MILLRMNKKTLCSFLAQTFLVESAITCGHAGHVLSREMNGSGCVIKFQRTNSQEKN